MIDSTEKLEEKPVHLQTLDFSLDPTKDKERMEKTKEVLRTYRERYGDLDFDKAYQSMFSLLWYSQLPCNDVYGLTSSTKDELSFIKRCYWKKRPISCNAIFQKRPTDRGMCCSFNIEKAENIFKKSKYTNVITTRQKHDSKNGFQSSRKPFWYERNNEPITSAGIENGLTLVFDAHSDQISSGSIFDSFQGIPVLVDGNKKFPMVRQSGTTARPGFENSISIHAFQVHANDEIKSISQKRRKCKFPEENNLDIHQEYAKSSCIFECKIKFAAKCISTCYQIDETCNCRDKELIDLIDLKSTNSCVPWFYPIPDGEVKEMCDPWKEKKFRHIMEMEIPMGQCNYCVEDCSSVKYQTSISYSELPDCDNSNIGSSFCDLTNGTLNPAPWLSDAQNEYLAANQSIPWFLKSNGSLTNIGTIKFQNKRSRYQGQNLETDEIFAEKLKLHPYYNAFEKDIGILNVFFADEYITRYVKEKDGTPFDHVSQLGGSLGGFMGISILSLVEILYWIFFRLSEKIF